MSIVKGCKMSSDDHLNDPFEKEEYVPAVFARTKKEADMYHQLLLDHEIESIIGYEEDEDSEDTNPERGQGLPVLVLESYLDEASEIIADREDQDEFDDEDDEDEDEEDEYEDFSPANEEDLEDLEDDDDDDDDDDDEDEDGDGKKYSGRKKMDFLDDLDDDMDFENDEFDDMDDDY